VRGNEQDATLRARGAVGPGPAGGDVSSESEGEEGGAAVRSTIEEGEFALGDATRPEPGEGSNGWLSKWRARERSELLQLVSFR